MTISLRAQLPAGIEPATDATLTFLAEAATSQHTSSTTKAELHAIVGAYMPAVLALIADLRDELTSAQHTITAHGLLGETAGHQPVTETELYDGCPVCGAPTPGNELCPRPPTGAPPGTASCADLANEDEPA